MSDSTDGSPGFLAFIGGIYNFIRGISVGLASIAFVCAPFVIVGVTLMWIGIKIRHRSEKYYQVYKYSVIVMLAVGWCILAWVSTHLEKVKREADAKESAERHRQYELEQQDYARGIIHGGYGGHHSIGYKQADGDIRWVQID